MSPTSLPCWEAAAGRDSHFLWKQGKTEASQSAQMLSTNICLIKRQTHHLLCSVGIQAPFRQVFALLCAYAFTEVWKCFWQCLCSCAWNPRRQVLLACRASSFIKVIVPKAFPSFSRFNEELQHPLDASHGWRDCMWVGARMCLPSAPTASGAAAITYKAQHCVGKVSS